MFDYNNLVQINAGGATFDTSTGDITVGNNADMISGGVHVPTVNQPMLNGTAVGSIVLKGGHRLISGITSNGVLEIQDHSTWDLNGVASSIGGLTGNGTVTGSPGAAVLTIGFDSFSGPHTYSGVIAGGGNVSVVKTGSGTQILSGANSYAGDTTVSGGILAVSGNQLPDAGKIVINGGKIELTGSETAGTLFFGATQQAAGTWGANGSGATHIDDTRFSGNGVLSVAAGPSGYLTWAAANAGGQTADQDFDHDGIENGVEYFMGETGSSFTANPGVVSGTVTWPKNAAFSGTYRVETSTELVTWDDVTGTVVDDGTSVAIELPSGESKLFVRLVVNPN